MSMKSIVSKKKNASAVATAIEIGTTTEAGTTAPSLFYQSTTKGSTTETDTEDGKKIGHIRFIREKMTKSITLYLIALTILGGAAGLLFFFDVSTLPIGEAIAIWGLAPIYTAFVAKWLLKEPISRVHFISLFVAIAGVLCIAQPATIFGNYAKHSNATTQVSSGSQKTIGYITSVIGPFVLTFIFIIFRKLQDIPTAFLTYSQGFGCIIGSVILMESMSLQYTPIRSGFQVFVLIGMGVSGFLGITTMSLAGQLIPSGLSTMLSQSEIVWGFLWQVTILHQATNWVKVIGVLAVIGAVIAVSAEQLKDTVKDTSQQQMLRLVNSINSMRLRSLSSLPHPPLDTSDHVNEKTTWDDATSTKAHQLNTSSELVVSDATNHSNYSPNGHSALSHKLSDPPVMGRKLHAILDNDSLSSTTSSSNEA